MKRGPLPATAGLALVLMVNLGGCLYRYHDAACKQRGGAYSARVETLKREAHEKLKVGTKKDAVIRFFIENGIPVTFSRDEASGTIHTSGCAPSGCGSDAALIGFRVKVNEEGSVIAEPVVGAIYTDCL
jgi:hypothetical protein